MNKKQTYTVAGHSFCLINEQNDAMWERMTPQYASFVDNLIQEPLFTLTVCNELPEAENTDFVYKDPNPNPREAKIDVYRTDSSHLFELTPHGGGELHSKLHLSADFKQGELLLRCDANDRFCGLNSALMLCYLLATVRLDTALMHASTIMNNGTAYLFLGCSGTGKTTIFLNVFFLLIINFNNQKHNMKLSKFTLVLLLSACTAADRIINEAFGVDKAVKTPTKARRTDTKEQEVL